MPFLKNRKYNNNTALSNKKNSRIKLTKLQNVDKMHKSFNKSNNTLRKHGTQKQ